MFPKQCKQNGHAHQYPVPPSTVFENMLNLWVQVLEGALVCKPGEAKVHLQLDAYVQATAQQCKLFLQKERVPAGRPRLKALASSSTIREALQGACIIEFPVLHVYLASDAPQIT